MGVVYRAIDLLLERAVALKLLRPEYAADPRLRQRFLREARTAASLVHPNIATIYEVGEVDASIFIAMELVPGTSLREVLARGRPGTGRALAWAVGIARALARAHEAGIVHRDLKPDNVMVLPDDQVKLLDFGIAKALGEGTGEQAMTMEGAVIGTPSYVSPEQARGERVDVRSDVFSFGTMLLEMLTGVRAFRGASPVETLAAVVRDPAPRLRELEPSAPPELDALIARCHAKEPGDRFANGGELLAALTPLAQQATGPSGPPPGDTLVEEPSARPPQAAVAASGPPLDAPVTEANVEAIAPPPRRTRPRALMLAVVAGTAALVAAGAFVRARPGATGAAPAKQARSTPVGCTSSAACSRLHDGAAWRCNGARHECVDVAGPSCTILASPHDLASDDTVWLGALLPTTGPAAEDIVSERRALDLARREVSEVLGGSAPPAGGMHARPIALVLCDESADPAGEARHLVDDVEVPAVVGFRWAKPALETIAGLLVPRHVLSFITVSQAPELTGIPQAAGEPRLVWRSTLNAADTGHPTAALIRALEPQIRAAGLGAGQMRIALVRTARGARSRDLTDVLFRELRFNGKSALENGDAFRQYVYGAEDAGVDRDVVVAKILDFAPQVIVAQGESFVHDIAEPLDASWHRGPRPIYIANSDLPDDAAAFVGTDAGRRRRFFGMTNVSTTTTNAELVLRYNLEFPGEPVTRAAAPSPSYDAFYMLAYAVEAIGAEPVDGPALSRAFTRLEPPGPQVEVGPRGILDAFKALHAGGRIDLEGAIGSLDFDPATGEAPIDYTILCFGVDDRGRALPSVDSGLVYESKTNVLRGTLRCP